MNDLSVNFNKTASMDDLHKSQIPKTPYCILYMKIYLNTGFDLLFTYYYILFWIFTTNDDSNERILAAF